MTSHDSGTGSSWDWDIASEEDQLESVLFEKGHRKKIKTVGNYDKMSSVPLMTLHNAGRRSSEAQVLDMASEEEDDPLESVLSKMKYRSSYHSHDFWSGLICSTVIGFVVGFIVSYITFVIMDGNAKLLQPSILNADVTSQIANDADVQVASLIIENISVQKMKEYERKLTAVPDNIQAQILHQHFKDCNFDTISPVQTVSVLLSYASLENRSTVELEYQEKVFLYHPENVLPSYHPYNAIMENLTFNYSDQVLVSDEVSVPLDCLIWIKSSNYQFEEYVTSTCSHKTIVLVEYENTPIIDLVVSIMRKGAVGIILYSNSAKTPLVSSLQYGIMQHILENPHTTQTQNPTGHHSCMPVLVLDFNSGVELRRISDQLKHRDLSLPFRVNLHMKMNFVHVKKIIYNVVAGIRGSLEPGDYSIYPIDRYIVLGSSLKTDTGVEQAYNTAAMMELARTFHSLRTSNNWRLQRSVIFYSWGISQVFGYDDSLSLIDSDHAFEGKLVAYIRLDIPADNGDFLISCSQLIASAVRYAWSYLPISKTKQDAAAVWHTVMEDTNNKYKQPAKENEENFLLRSLYRQGIPVVNVQYKQNIPDVIVTSTENKINEDSLKTITQLLGVFIWEVSDKFILPLNVSQFAISLNHSLSTSIDEFKIALGELLGEIKTSVEEFVNVATELQKKTESFNLSNTVKVRMFNDQLLGVEKSFFHHPEMSGESVMEVRPVILDPLNLIQYSSNFDRLRKLLSNMKQEKVNQSNKEAIKQHLESLQHCFTQATLVLKDPLDAFIS